MSASDKLIKELAAKMKQTFEMGKETSYATITAVDTQIGGQKVTGATGTVNGLDGVTVDPSGLQFGTGDVVKVARDRNSPSSPWTAIKIETSTSPTSGTAAPNITVPAPTITGVATAVYTPTL